jgi:hypothetical protein
MSESCREWRGDLAAAALGNLDPNDELRLQAHLDGCAACREELHEISQVARALPAADTTHAMARHDPPSVLGDRVLGRLAWERASKRKHRRNRFLVAAAAVVAVAAVSFGVIEVLPPSPQHDFRKVAFSVEPKGVHAQAVLQQQEYGTKVKLHVTGLNDGGWYWLWLTGDDGHRVAAGTFWARDDNIHVDMTSALQLQATRRVWVTDDKNTVVLDTGNAPALSAQQS